MHWLSRALRASLVAILAVMFVACSGQTISAETTTHISAAGPGATLFPSAAIQGSHAPVITLNGHDIGAKFNLVGEISGGGGDSRLLPDYPEPQRSQILDLLFKPKFGASTQILKIEAGGDVNSTNGAEPSVEHVSGQIDANSYELWIAHEAKIRNPQIKLALLQWGAPNWVKQGSTLWSNRDIELILNWLRVARSQYQLKFDYIGGWNEMGYNAPWYKALRSALNQNGFSYVKLMAADDAPTHLWQVAPALKADPSFNRSVGVVGDHDPADWPTTGYHCNVTAAARSLGKPLFASEIGKMPRDTGAAAMVRSVNRCYIDGGLTGFLEWPMVNALPDWFAIEDRGLLTLKQPWSGNFRVNLMTWAIAQTTQFTGPGWTYAHGAGHNLGNWGSEVGYLSPNHRDWSLVAENTGTQAHQKLTARTIHIALRNVNTRTIHAWATNLYSTNQATWFVPQPQDVRRTADGFDLTIPAGEVVSVTSTSGQSHGGVASPSAANLKFSNPHLFHADLSAEPWGLSAADGAFELEPKSNVIDQLAVGAPVFWGGAKRYEPDRHPYAVAGSSNWADYTVQAQVRLGGGPYRWAGLIGRFTNQSDHQRIDRFDGYELRLTSTGKWLLIKNYRVQKRDHPPAIIASGFAPGFHRGSWYGLSLSLHGSTVRASVGGRLVAVDHNAGYRQGLAGIESSWTRVQFRSLHIS